MIKSGNYNYDIYIIFKDQFVDSISIIDRTICELENIATYTLAVNELFRIFHGMKANSRYFNFEPIMELADKVEKVLSGLREEKPPVGKSIIEWLRRVKKQCDVWAEEMEDNDVLTFSRADVTLFNEVMLLDEEESPNEVMQRLSFLCFDENVKRAEKIVTAFKNSFLRTKAVTTLEEFEKSLRFGEVHICLINVQESYLEAVGACKRFKPDAARVVVLDRYEPSEAKKLSFEGIYHVLTNPLKAEPLRRELITVTESHFTSRRYLVNNKKIHEFIQTLQPLSESLVKILEVCDNEEASIRELIQCVKLDPIISAIILKASKNPKFGLQEIFTIDNAVTIFGKTRIKAIALSRMVDVLGTINLSPYSINEEIFSNVAILRLTLMIKWYAKVSIASLSILSSTAILGNIGQLLMAKEILSARKENLFMHLIESKNIETAEQKIMHTTTAKVTSDVLSYWQLNKEIVDSVRFSDFPKHAPQEIAHLALANHVVYRLIPLDGDIPASIPEDIYALLKENNLDAKALENAFKAVIELL